MKKLLVVLGLMFASISMQAGAATLSWVSTPAGAVAEQPDSWNLFGDRLNIAKNTVVNDSWTFNVNGSSNVLIAASNVPTWVTSFTLDGVDILVDAFSPAGFISALLTGDHVIHIEGITSSVLRSGYQFTVATPIPAAVWLFGSALMGMMGVSRRKKA